MRSPFVVMLVLLSVACGSNAKPAAESSADSAAAFPPSVTDTARDSTSRDSAAAPAAAPAADSGAAVSPTATTPATGTKAESKTPAKAESKAPAKAQTGIIGRDSAFGPMGSVDASGKVTPIEKKKP